MARFIRRQRKPKGPLPLRYVWLLSFIIFVVLSIQGLWLVEAKLRPTLVTIAKTETQKIATRAINDALSKKIQENSNMEDLIILDKDSQGNITSARFDPRIYNKVLFEVTYRVQRYLQMMEEGRVEELGLPDYVEIERDNPLVGSGIVHTIPLGQATNNALLAQLGPEIPVSFTMIGDVKTQMKETIETHGINNTWINVSIEIVVDVKVVIPFATEMAVVSTPIPVGMIFVPGKVPEFYGNGNGGLPAPAIIQEPDNENE